MMKRLSSGHKDISYVASSQMLYPAFWREQRVIMGRNKTRDQCPGPKSGTKFCQQNIAIKHACIELKFGSNVDYRFCFEMHKSIFLHMPYFNYMHVK